MEYILQNFSGCLGCHWTSYIGILLLSLLAVALITGAIHSRNYYRPNPGVCLSLKENWKGPVLFVTAHPDDECMFFGPSMINSVWNAGKENVYLLCLTTGNYYGLGSIRKKELFKAAKELGLNLNNVFVVDDSAFLDGGDQHWDSSKVFNEIENKIKQFKIRTVVTFDDYGVSGHINHVAIYVALSTRLCRNYCIPNSVKLYTLESVNMLRKYSSIIDLAYSVIHTYVYLYFNPNGQILFLSGLSDLLKLQKAMRKHGSQLVWFRHLYVLFSRYMMVNNLKLEGRLNV